MTDGNDVERFQFLGKIEYGADAVHAVGVGIGACPYRAESEGVDGKQDVFGGSRKVLCP